MEYSVCTCRWTNESVSPRSTAVTGSSRHDCGTASTLEPAADDMPEPHRSESDTSLHSANHYTPIASLRQDQGMRADPSAVATAIRADLAHALVAVDFDGTLAPIVPNPVDSRPVPGAV